MGMKGVVPALTIFAMVIAVMFVLVIGQFIYYLLHKETTLEYFLFDIYTIKNGVNLANLYLENSLDYSVYQAMFDNGRRGGWKEVPSGLRYTKNLGCSYTCGLTEEKMGGKLLGCGDGKYGCNEGDKNAENYNDQIGKLQCILNNLKDGSGNPYYAMGIDCKFGAGTLEAVKKFQKDNGWKETGVVNESILNELRNDFVLSWDNCDDFFRDCKNTIRSYWQETANVLSPSRKDVNDSLRSAITENLNQYVKGGFTFLSKYYTLPTFKSDGIIVSDLDGETGIFANTDKNIHFHDVIIHETGEERIDIKSSPKLGNTYPADYFRLYDKSVEVFNEMKSKQCTDLKKDDKLKDNVKDNGYVTNAVVFEKKDTPCEAILKINVTDSGSRFPVFNGINITFEPISMVFFVKIA